MTGTRSRGAHRAAGVQAPETHLPSLATWRSPYSPSFATIDDHVVGSQVPGRAKGHPGQPWQANRGRRSRGRKNLAPTQRLQLAQGPAPPREGPPTRRVWIPKPDATEQRPLGIPTIQDRAAQALAKLALEPECGRRGSNRTATGSAPDAQPMTRSKPSSSVSTTSRNTSWTPTSPSASIASTTSPARQAPHLPHHATSRSCMAPSGSS